MHVDKMRKKLQHQCLPYKETPAVTITFQPSNEAVWTETKPACGLKADFLGAERDN